LSIKVTKDRTAAVLKAMRGLERKQALVGIPDSTAERRLEDDEGPINNAMIGRLMEDGSPAQNLPARPHLKPAVREVKPELIRRYRTGTKAVLDGALKDPDKIHHAVGLIAENAVKAKITEGNFAPLSPRTIQARKRRGRKSEKPLVDTGQYRNSITHVVRPKR
jgi:hypothetical protein